LTRLELAITEEFEFNWWDHVFNKAAKSVKVENNEGEVRVDFNSDKSELSTKKMRRKAQKEIKNKLYSNFVKSGTLMGGKMEEEEDDTLIEVKDLSKLKELTDEELVAACGGRTAHKGGRHGHKMTAKLDRIAEAEREYMENYHKKNKDIVNADKFKKKTKSSNEDLSDVNDVCKVPTEIKVKKKKKKRALEVEDQVEESLEEPIKKKKKHKKEKEHELEKETRKKHKKSKL